MRDKTSRAKTVNDILFGTFTGNAATRYGIANEIIAKEQIEDILKQKIQPAGLIVDNNMPFIAASPDGILDDGSLIEIKCPVSAKDLTPEDAIQNSMKIKVNGFEINYYMFGNGPHKLLIFPGALGRVNDFISLTENFDQEKYTIYVWDPPGYGLSRPPIRDFSPGFLYRDADCAIALMETLGIDRYSMLGWCNGGCTALIAASKAADRVDKLVVWSCNAFVTCKDVEFYETTRDIYSWPLQIRLSQIKLYGERYLIDTYSGWIDAIWKILNEHDGDLCRGALAQIKAPTLILHGAQDALVSVDHAEYLHENIENSTLEIFPNGKHFIHVTFPEKFIAMVDNFLTPIQ